MAYDPKTENLARLRHIVTHLFDFSGRSQRSELVVYIAAMMVLSLTILLLNALLSEAFGVPYGAYIQDALWLTAIPLFVRRLHDQDRSGWFALILLAVLTLRFYERIQFDMGRFPLPDVGYPYKLVAMALVVAFWVFAFWPGTDGENRFGPDPRKDIPA
jgi:uncharacterized membrane protein YhaH (DUF805 family)